jgi:hypothetical protein
VNDKSSALLDTERDLKMDSRKIFMVEDHEIVHDGVMNAIESLKSTFISPEFDKNDKDNRKGKRRSTNINGNSTVNVNTLNYSKSNKFGASSILNSADTLHNGGKSGGSSIAAGSSIAMGIEVSKKLMALNQFSLRHAKEIHQASMSLEGDSDDSSSASSSTAGEFSSSSSSSSNDAASILAHVSQLTKPVNNISTSVGRYFGDDDESAIEFWLKTLQFKDADEIYQLLLQDSRARPVMLLLTKSDDNDQVNEQNQHLSQLQLEAKLRKQLEVGMSTKLKPSQRAFILNCFLHTVLMLLSKYHISFGDRESAMNDLGVYDPVANRIRAESSFRLFFDKKLQKGTMRKEVLRTFHLAHFKTHGNNQQQLAIFSGSNSSSQSSSITLSSLSSSPQSSSGETSDSSIHNASSVPTISTDGAELSSGISSGGNSLGVVNQQVPRAPSVEAVQSSLQTQFKQVTMKKPRKLTENIIKSVGIQQKLACSTSKIDKTQLNKTIDYEALISNLNSYTAAVESTMDDADNQFGAKKSYDVAQRDKQTAQSGTNDETGKSVSASISNQSRHPDKSSGQSNSANVITATKSKFSASQLHGDLPESSPLETILDTLELETRAQLAALDQTLLNEQRQQKAIREQGMQQLQAEMEKEHQSRVGQQLKKHIFHFFFLFFINLFESVFR